MLRQFMVDGMVVDALDLKIMLLASGAVISDKTYRSVAAAHRLGDPTSLMSCNCVILPDGVAAHLTANSDSPFEIGISANGQPHLSFHGQVVTLVDFPPATGFYSQVTSSGKPFGSYAVLEGMGILAFHYLWPCQFAREGQVCSFCFQGMADLLGMDLPSPGPLECGEMVAWGLKEGCVREVQLTGGSRRAPAGECPEMAAVLRGIDQIAGLGNVPGEVYAYISAPAQPEAVDEVFNAGVDRVAYDLNIWDLDLHAQACPGHASQIGRDAQLRALEYVARHYGPNRACSAFVVGLEPLESLAAGAEYLGSRGIVPLFSAWLPGTGAVVGRTTPPDIHYYRRAREAFARIYRRYDLNPPGITAGAHVSLCRDIYEHLDDILLTS